MTITLMDSKKKFDMQDTLDIVFENMSNVSLEQFVAELGRKSEKLTSSYSRKGSAQQYNQGANDYIGSDDVNSDRASILRSNIKEQHLLQVHPFMGEDL